MARFLRLPEASPAVLLKRQPRRGEGGVVCGRGVHPKVWGSVAVAADDGKWSRIQNI